MVAYHEKYPGIRYLGIANDGINFRVYQSVLKNNNVTEIEFIDAIDLDKATAEDVFPWFDSYLFASEKVLPTSKDLKKRFGQVRHMLPFKDNSRNYLHEFKLNEMSKSDIRIGQDF